MGDCESSVSRDYMRLLRVPPTASSASGVASAEKWDRLKPVVSRSAFHGLAVSFRRRAAQISQATGSTDISTMPTTTSSKFFFTIGTLPKK